MDIFNTWKIFKNPENLRKLGYAIAIFCAITLLVSIVCGIVSYSGNKEEKGCLNVPPQCREKIYDCEELPDGLSFLDFFVLQINVKPKNSVWQRGKVTEKYLNYARKGTTIIVFKSLLMQVWIPLLMLRFISSWL